MLDAHQPLWLVLVGNFVTQSVGYFVVVGLLFVVVWRWGQQRFAGARIPGPRKFDGAQWRREVKNTFVTFVAGTTSAGGVIALHAAGYTRLDDAAVPWGTTLAWTAGCLAFNDLWFYGWHRLLHTPALFARVHAVHHKSVDVNPFTSYSFHAFEAFILGLWIVPAAMVLPLPVSALGLLQVIGLANNVNAHLGYEFLPRWLLRVPLLKWTNTATFHSLHHTRLHGNYGLHTRLWDRLFATELPEYERVFVERAAGSGASLAAAPRD
jgi:sterol desaturase/sphingolipid hydroxylase (fatty acid hydroxylase superfamily)